MDLELHRTKQWLGLSIGQQRSSAGIVRVGK
jgi:hypothetical protein